MRSINVLIIDSNILVRRAVTNILEKHEIFDVFWVPGISENVEQIISESKPDVLLLSIENMESDGLTLLNTIRKNYPKMAVIALTPRSKEGGEAALTALRLGAIDFVTIPHHKNLILFAERHLKKRLAPMIQAANKFYKQKDLDEETLKSFINTQKEIQHLIGEQQTTETAEIIVMGGCTGGPQGLFSLLPNLPGDLRVPIVIVQHFPRIYTKILAEKLNAFSNLNVRETQNGVNLREGDVWLASGGYHSEISLSGYSPIITTHRGLRENNNRPSIDVLFRSASKVYGDKTLGILLSGSGPDGVAGAEEIRKQGGQLIVQDPRTTIVPEMPLTAIKRGLAREYYATDELAHQIVQRVTHTDLLQPSDQKPVSQFVPTV